MKNLFRIIDTYDFIRRIFQYFLIIRCRSHFEGIIALFESGGFGMWMLDMYEAYLAQQDK